MYLLQVLEKRAKESPGKIAFTFHNDPPCTYRKLWEEINGFGGYLLHRGLRNKAHVIIAIPNSAQFFHAFYGVQRAGGIAVPIFPGSGVERIVKLAELCRAEFIVISDSFPNDKAGELTRLSKEHGWGDRKSVV